MRRIINHLHNVLVCLIISGVFICAATAVRAEETSLPFPQTAAEIEQYFLQHKPRTFQTKGPGTSQSKGTGQQTG